MAARSFLLDKDLSEARARLRGEGTPDFSAWAKLYRLPFSLWLEERLLDRLNMCGDFLALKPVLLGSWARHELTPRSDIDVLFLGEEEQVQTFVAEALKAGLKLRCRTPMDAKDWSVGVEPFDVLALKSARAFTADVQQLLEPQAQLALKRRREILKVIRKERDERRTRQDSIANFLEPNLKYGIGGLRDIEQALVLHDLYADRYTENYPFAVLRLIKEELLYLRSLLHLHSGGEILSAHDQLEIADFFETRQDVGGLMKLIQSELERASFYGDWIVAHAGRAGPKAKAIESLEEAIDSLKQRPTLDLQYSVRLQVDALAKPLTVVERGALLQTAIQGDAKDAFFVSLQRSRILEVLLPDLKKLRGLVQHDHYHRFTADAHLIQTLREVQRCKTQRRALGVMSSLTRDLTPQEWWILKLTALFHDLGKGRKGDHSTEGARLVDRYFSSWEYPENIKEEVRWLVEQHLVLSTAAFRQNPQSQSTWKRLFARGVHGRRLILLTLFTAIDIRATNPEAWTEWKAQLLLNLLESMRSSEATSLQKHLRFAGEEQLPQVQDWLLNLDPLLLESLSPKLLVGDLREVGAAKGDAPLKIVRVKNRLWVRLHRRVDLTGLFLNFVTRLYALGLNVQVAAVTTLNEVGIYDWFCLKTDKTPRQIQQWLNIEPASALISARSSTANRVSIPTVRFQSVELMASDDDEWIFSFKGKDQRGLLLAAAHALVEENLSLRWARVHTWGQQIEDIFSVKPTGRVELILNRLQSRFIS